MIHIIHIADGHKHFEKAINEYQKRLGKNITIHTIRPIKHTDINFIKNTETAKILEKLTKIRWNIFLCDETGKHISTTVLANIIQECNNHSENMIFVIGGSYGFNLENFSNPNIKIMKLSEFVLPHSLAFLVLIEQIYRSFEIIKWSGYHHQ